MNNTMHLKEGPKLILYMCTQPQNSLESNFEQQERNYLKKNEQIFIELLYKFRYLSSMFIALANHVIPSSFW